MSGRGFTLIELMIVVAIVAIIAAISVASLIRSRLVANEAAAIGAVKAFGNGQEMYRRTDWDGDGYLEYAKNIGPNGGRGNGESLYFNNRSNAAIELVEKSLADAEGDPGAPNVIAKCGYVFQMQLDMTWPRVRSFTDNANNLMAGYGISAVPLRYDVTGINKFQLSSDGVVYQNDTGDNVHMVSYDVNPANGWLAAE